MAILAPVLVLSADVTLLAAAVCPARLFAPIPCRCLSHSSSGATALGTLTIALPALVPRDAAFGSSAIGECPHIRLCVSYPRRWTYEMSLFLDTTPSLFAPYSPVFGYFDLWRGFYSRSVALGPFLSVSDSQHHPSGHVSTYQEYDRPEGTAVEETGSRAACGVGTIIFGASLSLH